MAWFMQDFSETVLVPVERALVAPSGDDAEAFVVAENIAAVVPATLGDPESHVRAEYAPTGPEPVTMSEAASIISHVTRQTGPTRRRRSTLLGSGSDRSRGDRGVRRNTRTAH